VVSNSFEVQDEQIIESLQPSFEAFQQPTMADIEIHTNADTEDSGQTNNLNGDLDQATTTDTPEFTSKHEQCNTMEPTTNGTTEQPVEGTTNVSAEPGKLSRPQTPVKRGSIDRGSRGSMTSQKSESAKDTETLAPPPNSPEEQPTANGEEPTTQLNGEVADSDERRLTDEGEPQRKTSTASAKSNTSAAAHEQHRESEVHGNKDSRQNGEVDESEKTDSTTSGVAVIGERADSTRSSESVEDVADSGPPRAASALSNAGGELSVIAEKDEKTSQSYEKPNGADVPAQLNPDGTEPTTPTVIVNSPIVAATVTPLTSTPPPPPPSAAAPVTPGDNQQQVTFDEDNQQTNGERRPTTPGGSPEHDVNNKDNQPESPTSPAFENSLKVEAKSSKKWWSRKQSTSATTTPGNAQVDPAGCCTIL